MLPQVSLTPSLPNQEKTKYGTLLEVIYSNFVEEAGLSLTNHTLCYTLLSSEPNDRTWLQTWERLTCENMQILIYFRRNFAQIIET